jgi:DNA-binding XRE family transcriptional regulator
MLLGGQAEARVSTGLDALDDVLGGLYWGDNVVWRLDRAPVEPFYRAVAASTGTFETRTVVSLGSAVNTYGVPGLAILEAASGTYRARPADLLHEIRRICQARGRRLFLFESLDSMVRTWGAAGTREFFSRCCSLLLDAGAIAYWTMSAHDTPAVVQETAHVVTQCMLHVDERSVRVVKAEGRNGSVRGSVLHWHEQAGRAVLAPPEIVGRVAGSLRAVRSARKLSQHDMGDLAGVTASAISQAERAERGLSLATLVRLSAALDVTIDDLLRGEDVGVYQLGRRTDDPRHGFVRSLTLLGGPGSDVLVDLVHLDARETADAPATPPGTGLVAVANGLVEVMVADQTPAIRHGEVLVAASEQIRGWHNLGQTEAMMFWIVFAAGPRDSAQPIARRRPEATASWSSSQRFRSSPPP